MSNLTCPSLTYTKPNLSKNKTRVLERATPDLGVKLKRRLYIFVYFLVLRLVWLLFKIGLCSGISFERSRRKLSINMAEHGLYRKITKIRTGTVPPFEFHIQNR